MLIRDPLELSTPFPKKFENERCNHCTNLLHSKEASRVITFEEMGNIHPSLLNSDPIVITANIGGIEIEDLLVDGGSACDILSLNTFKQMGIPHDLVKEGNGYLRGITGHDTLILRIVKLLMTLG